MMILITGATGLLGSKLLHSLVLNGNKVRAIRRQTSDMFQVNRYLSSDDSLQAQIEWVNADLLDYQTLEDALVGVSQVYHCAAIVSFDSSDKHRLINENVVGTANLVNACIDKDRVRLCHVSSVAALGRSIQGEHINEDSQWKNSIYNTTYATSKYQSEKEVWRGIAEGLDAVIVNPSIIIGPGDWRSTSSLLFSKIYKGLKFYTTGKTGFVGLNDVVNIMIQLMNSRVSSERFILNSENIYFKNMFEMIAKELDVAPPSIEAGKFLSGVAWRILALKSFVFGGSPEITKEHAISSSKISNYQNDKIKKQLNYSFDQISDVVAKTSKVFKAEQLIVD